MLGSPRETNRTWKKWVWEQSSDTILSEDCLEKVRKIMLEVRK
jgi:hypothetical protein